MGIQSTENIVLLAKTLTNFTGYHCFAKTCDKLLSYINTMVIRWV